jgi:hypothetical protein
MRTSCSPAARRIISAASRPLVPERMGCWLFSRKVPITFDCAYMANRKNGPTMRKYHGSNMMKASIYGFLDKGNALRPACGRLGAGTKRRRRACRFAPVHWDEQGSAASAASPAEYFARSALANPERDGNRSPRMSRPKKTPLILGAIALLAVAAYLGWDAMGLSSLPGPAPQSSPESQLESPPDPAGRRAERRRRARSAAADPAAP